jgi:hypothetical protein
VKILFKNGDKFFGGDGKEATEQEVETFLASLEPEISAVEAVKVPDLEKRIVHGTGENNAQIREIGNLRDALVDANTRAAELEQTKVELEKAKADTKVLEDFITELQETAKVATPADIKAVLEAKVTETAKAKKA